MTPIRIGPDSPSIACEECGGLTEHLEGCSMLVAINANITKALNELQVAGAEWAIAGILNKDRSVKRTLAARSAIETICDSLRHMIELRDQTIDSLKEIALTPYEAETLLISLAKKPFKGDEFDERYEAAERAIAKLTKQAKAG